MKSATPFPNFVVLLAHLHCLDFSGTSDAVRKDLYFECGASETLGEKLHQVAAATRKAPLIVVPSHDFDAVRSYHARMWNIYDRGIRISAKVHRDELLVTERADHSEALRSNGLFVYCAGKAMIGSARFTSPRRRPTVRT